MKMNRIGLLFLAVCALAGLLSGCKTGKPAIDWDSYDETTTRLSLYGHVLKDADIVAVQNLTGLVYLSLTDNQISDLSPLANLTNLTELRLGDNKISDLTPLANLTNLTKLYLGNNQISDLTPLAKLTNLAELYLGRNQISDLSPLANLINLTALFIDTNKISDLTPLAKLTNLTDLHLSDNQIKDLAPLANLKNLTYLGVLGNSIGDWSHVAHVEYVEGKPANAVLLTDQTTTLKTGAIFRLSFEETQSIPSRWKAIMSDESLVRVICTEVDSRGLTSSAPGSRGEVRILYFQALNPGECTIDMYSLPINADYDIDRLSPSHVYTVIIED